MIKKFDKEFNYVPLALFSSILFVYWLLIIFLDNTNITTTNGLYKSFSVMKLVKGTGFDLDSGGFLYIPSMAFLSIFIPDSLVDFYGTIANFNMYRKLAFINSIFGALASTIVYCLAYNFTSNKLCSIAATIFHASSSYILIDSIISEDVMPAYFFFILSIYCFYKFLYVENSRLYLTCMTSSIFLMMTLHWTLFPPAAFGYGIAAILLIKQDKKYIRFFVEQVILFFLVVFVVSTSWNYIVHSNIPKVNLLDILMPGKASGSWVGWGIGKISLSILGIGNYLLGSERQAFLSDVHTHFFIGWVIVLFSIWVTIKFSNPQKYKQYIFSILILSIFFSAQIENLYATGEDPQFQLQPMFIITYAFIAIYKIFNLQRRVDYIAVFLAITIAAYNIICLLPYKGKDSDWVLVYKEFRMKYPKNNTSIISHGYEGFFTWLWLFDYNGSWDELSKDNFLFSSYVQKYKKGDDIAKHAIIYINNAMKHNKTIIGISPWLGEISVLHSQNLSQKEIDILANKLLQTYKIKSIHNLYKTKNFAELESYK